MKILRTMGILALVAGLLLGGAGGALAQEPEPELAEIEGVIKAIDIDTDDTEAGTVTILPEEGEKVTLTIITGETEIKKDGVTATIDDLAKDDEVEALYNPETLEAVEIAAKSPEPAENGGSAGEPRAGGSSKRGPHSPKHGLFGTVISPVTKIDEVTYVIKLDTEEGIVGVTANVDTKYMVPRLTKGPVDLAGFEVALGESITTIVGRRLALLVTPLTADTPPLDYTATAIKLMLIPSSDSPPLWAHRVGIVDTFISGADGSIEIIDRHGVSHPFDVDEYTIYRPEGKGAGDILVNAPWSLVTVVTKGDPRVLVAKTIVLHIDEAIAAEWPLPER